MEYRFSAVVDPSTYESEGLCTGIDVRISHNSFFEDLGAIEALEDWNEHIAAPRVQTSSSLGPLYNFLSVAFPEILPSRMRILAYFTEFIFLHDDVVETVDQSQGDRMNDEAMEVCLDSTASCSVKANRKSGTKWMMSKISEEVLALDARSGSAALALWAEWFAKGGGRRNHTRFDTLDEYMEYRILDVGEKFLTGVAIFGMGLVIPECEIRLLSELCYPAWVALGLTNDLFSLEKEKAAADRAGETHLNNSIWVMMQEHSISEAEAERLCRKKVEHHVAQFVEIVQETKIRRDVSANLCAFVESIQYVISGNLVWTLGSPRYNPHISHNARQIEWMTFGIPRGVGDRAR